METIESLRVEAAGCRQCPLYATASQTVFGEGPAPAPLMLVGEQPGDQEDVVGRPFVGPAGLLLDRALSDAGLDRRAVYVTNAVKHFKFLARGKRRLHQKPTILEIRACLSWLDREMAAVRPRVVVALGATAARALSGRDLKIGAARGRRLALGTGAELLVTVHPSYLLRLPDEAARAREYDTFVADLRQVADLAPLSEPAPAEATPDVGPSRVLTESG
jgi:DNA polymerase